MRGPWTARRSNQSILKEIKPEYSLEGLMAEAEAEAPIFGLLIRKVNSLEKSLILGKIECRRRKGHQRMRWMDNITNAMNMNLGKLQEMMRDRESWHADVHGITKSQT